MITDSSIWIPDFMQYKDEEKDTYEFDEEKGMYLPVEVKFEDFFKLDDGVLEEIIRPKQGRPPLRQLEVLAGISRGSGLLKYSEFQLIGNLKSKDNKAATNYDRRTLSRISQMEIPKSPIRTKTEVGLMMGSPVNIRESAFREYRNGVSKDENYDIELNPDSWVLRLTPTHSTSEPTCIDLTKLPFEEIIKFEDNPSPELFELKKQQWGKIRRHLEGYGTTLENIFYE